MEQKKEFTGVFIPRHILEDEQLNVYEKQLYAEISCFDECYLSNEKLAKRLSCTEVTITRYVKKLKNKGYVEQTRFDGRMRYLRSLKDNPKKIETSLKDEADTSISVGQTSLKDNQDNIIEKIEKTDVANAPFPSYKGTLTGTGELGTNKPRTPREFANARRAELGKPPLQPNRTEKQDLAVQALKLIDYFKQTFYEKHGEGVDAYFGGDPEENGKYTKLAKACILLLGKDSERYVEEWIGGLGEFFQYDPSNCWSSSQMRKWKVSKSLKNKDSEIKPEYI